MSHVLVTGGHGFIGSHLVERLNREGHEVTVFDLAPPPPDLRIDQATVRHVAGDVRDEAALAAAITSDVDTVYHLSAMVGVDRYLHHPLDVLDVNVLGTRNVLRAALDTGTKVVVASTSEVFGKNPNPPWSEDSDRVLGSTAADRWTYSSSKAVAEHMTFALIRQSGLRATIVRYFNVYGPRQRPAYVVSRTVHRLLRGLPPLVYDTGEQNRCFTYVDDAIDATVRAGTNPAADGQAYNVGSHTASTIEEVIRLAIRLTGNHAKATRLDTGAALGETYEDIPRRIPDTTKAQQQLGWQCVVPLRDGLLRTIHWARSNPWWLESVPTTDAPSRNMIA